MLYVYSALFFLIFLFSSISIEAATLHVIIATHTSDAHIGVSSQQDLKKFQQIAHNIAQETGLLLEEHLFKDQDYQAEAIVACIESLHVLPEDVVCYFHSSHGVHTYSMGLAELPILDFGHSAALYLSNVVHLIEEKQPRLKLIVADCCQTWTDDAASSFMLQVCVQAHAHPIAKIRQAEQYQRLFLIPRGTIIILGSSPGELAYGTIKGSYCTHYLKQTLTSLTKAEPPLTWQALLQETQRLVKKFSSRPSEDPPFLVRPQHIWYSIQIDTEEPYVSPVQPSFTPQWKRTPFKEREFIKPAIEISEEDKKELEELLNAGTPP